MKGLILLVSVVQIAFCLPQQGGSFQDFNRDRDQHGSQQGNPQDPFANRNFFPQTFSGNVNNTSASSPNGNFPNRNEDRDRVSFNNGNFRTTESTTRSRYDEDRDRGSFNNGNFRTTENTTRSRYDDRQDTFHYEHDKTESPRGGGHDQPFGVSPHFEISRTSMSPTNNQHPSGVDHRPKGVNDKSYSSGATVNQSFAFYLIGFCCLLKFY